MRVSAWLFVGLSGLLCLVVWSVDVLADTSVAPLAQEEEQIVHVVQAGDTVFSIAQQYGTTVDAIAAANDLADPSLIAVGQQLIIPTGDEVSGSQPAAGSADPVGEETSSAPVYHTYTVLPSDTLDVIARRFNVTATVVARLNGVVQPADLPVGGQLRVPGQYVGRLHPVAEGETALGLALRYKMSLWEFLTANDLNSPAALLPGQRVVVPGQVTTGTLLSPFKALDVGPVPVLQGNAVRVKVDLVPGAKVRGVFDDQELNFAIEEDVHYALFGVHALDEPGLYSLALLATDATSDEVYLTQSIEVVDGGYDYEEISLSVDLADSEALVAERERVAEIKSTFNPERYWDGLFLRPIDTEITSFFGTTRLYQSPSYSFYGYHEGTDFNGEVGTPVYAPAAGIVVLAEPLYLRGNAVVIDHGWGVYTGYWHLSQIDVTVGQQVAPGDPIALVGSTGRSTGAHLHWDFWVNGTNVSALQWTEQVFP